MVRTASTMMALGTEAPDFALPDLQGNTVRRDDFRGKKALLVIFMCNHCPFVQHIIDEVVTVARQYQQQGVAVVAINSNDVEKYPGDSPEQMEKESERLGFTFPYLFDEDQEVAKAYQAACTPDFFLFDQDLKLAYRGQFDDARPGNEIQVTGRDLMAAMDAVLAGEQPTTEQRPSAGCNIKWKPGNEPTYFKPA